MSGKNYRIKHPPREKGKEPLFRVVYVIDVSAGDKIPRKGGPGITKSDLLVINKIDLAAYVGASLDVMARDAKKMRGERPFVFTNLKTGEGLQQIIDFIQHAGMVEAA